MSDLLIRNIPPALKSELKRRAAKNGRILSEEGKLLIRKGLGASGSEMSVDEENTFDAIRRTFADARLTEEQQRIFDEALEESRADQGRDFDWET